MKDRSIFRVGLLASTMLASTSLLAMAGDVTTPRLLNADKEPQNWLMVNKDYAAHRFSELDQINKNNVKDLHVAFTVALGGVEGLGKVPLGGHQSTPLVDDGSMFVVDGFGAVYRIDVREPAKARIAWIMDPGTNKADFMVATNRGVTLYKNFVVSVTADCKVIWTKADTGELVKTVQFDDPKRTHCTLTSAPLVIDDKLIVGGSGGDQGARPYRCAERGYRRVALADLLCSGPRRARQRDLERRHQRLGAWGRILLGNRLIRSGDQADNLGHRSTGSYVRSGIPPGR